MLFIYRGKSIKKIHKINNLITEMVITIITKKQNNF